MNTGPSPSEIRKARRLLIAAMVLAWATHLLVAQWSHAAETGDASPLRITIRDEARISGAAIRLDDVCHLEGAAAETLASRTIAFLPATPNTSAEIVVDLRQILQALEEAGIGRGNLEISGATRCRVTSSGTPAPTEAAAATDEWADIDAHHAHPATGSTRPGVAVGPTTLGACFREDLATRLGVDAAALALTFSHRDQAVASLPAGRLRVGQVKPIRGGDDLGRVTWEIAIDRKPRQVTAEATMEVEQLVAARPVGRGQTLQASDLAQESRTISRLADRTPGPADAVGAAAGRDLAQGEVITFKKLAPTLLAERGQFVTVRVSRGAVEIRLLARAQESGGFGQVIRAINDQTGDSLYVTLTGPQSGVMRPDAN